MPRINKNESREQPVGSYRDSLPVGIAAGRLFSGFVFEEGTYAHKRLEAVSAL